MLAGGKNCNKNTFLPHKKLNVKEAFNQIKSVFHFYKLCKMWIIIMWNLMLRNYKKGCIYCIYNFLPILGKSGQKVTITLIYPPHTHSHTIWRFFHSPNRSGIFTVWLFHQVFSWFPFPRKLVKLLLGKP